MNLVVNWKIFEKRTSSCVRVRLFNEAASELTEALADITWRKGGKSSIH